MDILKEMKKKIVSIFREVNHEEERPSDQISSVKESLRSAEKEKLEEYPSLRQKTPENRDISPY